MITSNFINIRHILIILLFAVNFNTMHGQQTTPVNEKYVNVDLFHGNLNVSIPLNTVKARTLSCPVSLNYSQVNLNESNDKQYYAGPTGLGWTLVGGGCITRTINGLPDETNFFNSESMPKGNFLNNSENFDAYNDTDYDPEEDVFSFNFGGHTGTFIYHRGEWKIFSDEDFDIKRNLSMTYGLYGFTIVTNDGMIYEFGGEGSLQIAHKSISSILGQTGKTVANAWHLTKIASPEGESIYFDYVNSDIAYPPPSRDISIQNNYYEDYENLGNVTKVLKSSFTNEYYFSGYYCQQVVLSLITCSKNGSFVKFNYENTTEPFNLNDPDTPRNPLKLDNVEVGYDNTLKKYVLTYDDKSTESLKLTSLQEFAISGNTVTGSMPAFTFLYADKDNPTNPQALTQLTYPTGGYTTFEYQYASGLEHLRISKQTSHGAGETDKELATMYYYGEVLIDENLVGNNGFGTQKPVNNGYIDPEQNSILDNIYVSQNTLPGGTSLDPLIATNTYRYTIRDVDNYYIYQVDAFGGYKDRIPNATVQQKETGYSSVWVAQLAKDATNKEKVIGYKHFSFVNFKELDANNKTIYQNANDVGKITQYEEFNSKCEILNRITYEYERINEETLKCYTIHSTKYKHISGNSLIWYEPYFYALHHYKYKLVKEKEEHYTGLTKRTEYEYDPTNYLLRTKRMLGYHPNIDGEGNDGEPYSDQTTTYRYFSDFNDPFYSHVQPKYHSNGMDMPIETIHKKNGKITGVEFTTVTLKEFTSGFGSLKPATIYTLDITQPINESEYTPVSQDWSTLDSKLKPRISYEYDDNGNKVGQTDANGQKSCYIGCDTESNMPLEVVKGMTYAEYMNNSTLNNNSDPENVMNKRATFPNIQITSYTYDLRFGVTTSVTTPNGLTTYYEYDDFGRLHYVKDNNKKLLKTYEYTSNVQ